MSVFKVSLFSPIFYLFLSIGVSTALKHPDRLCTENHPFPDHYNSSEYSGVDYFFYLLDEASQKCYHKEKQGPCGNFMTFEQAQDDSEVGACSCLFMEDRCDVKIPIGLDKPIVRADKDQLCYLLFQQGPCKTGEILNLNPNGTGTCTVNPCQNMPEPEINWKQIRQDLEDIYKLDTFPLITMESYNWYLYKGKCYKTFSQGHCKNKELAAFKGTNPIPQCFDGIKSIFNGCPFNRVVSSGKLRCPKPSIRSGKDCVYPTRTFQEEQ